MYNWQLRSTTVEISTKSPQFSYGVHIFICDSIHNRLITPDLDGALKEVRFSKSFSTSFPI